MRQWAWEQTELDSPLDLAGFCVMRNLLEVSVGCRDRENTCRDRWDHGDHSLTMGFLFLFSDSNCSLLPREEDFGKERQPIHVGKWN